MYRDVQDLTAPTPESQRIAHLEGELAALQARLETAESTVERLRRAYTQALEQLQLLRRRMFVAKAERPERQADQLAFDAMFAQVQRLEKELEAEERKGDDDRKRRGTRTSKPTGRRDLREADLPEVRVEIDDPALEGHAERIGFEESSRLGYERGGMRRIIVARVVYKVAPVQAPVAEAAEGAVAEAADVAVSSPGAPAADGAVPSASSREGSDAAPQIVTAPLPRELFRRGLLAPSMIAHVLAAKYMMGVPFYRLEQKFELEGVPLDRGTMCRYAEDAGATLGAIVEAARVDAMQSAFCLSTDATGVSIQPGPVDERGPRACRKGHFFVVLADRDHVFFEYQSKHTSEVVCSMFKGFTGYIQADAHAIYDALFDGRSPRGKPPDPDQGPPPIEVGCWSHCRRNFWEAAVCKHPLGVQGLRHIDVIFAAEARLKDLAPAQRTLHRGQFVRPLVDTFYDWVRSESVQPRERGLVATALGYTLRQEPPLRRFLDDGRLKMDNNASERALRTIATGRKAWLFFGSDDHASAAANLFSLIASCKLHRLDPERYLAEVIRVMPYWPRARYLELTPRDWARTRARLDPNELALPLGLLTIPPPLPAEQQTPSD